VRKDHALSVSSAERSRLFREVNDRIYDLLESADPDLPGDFLCECGRDCGLRVALLPSEFASLREGGGVVRSSECRWSRLGRRWPRSRIANGVPALR
jgi:hypothetical protein